MIQLKKTKIPVSESAIEKRLQIIKAQKKLRLVKMQAGYELIRHDLRETREGIALVKDLAKGVNRVMHNTESPRQRVRHLFYNFGLEWLLQYLRRK